MNKGKKIPPNFVHLIAVKIGGDDVRVWGADDHRGPWQPVDEGSDKAMLESLILEAVARLRNSYRCWTGGVPDMISGEMIDVTRSTDWFVFLEQPHANHTPIELRLAMGERYLDVALEKNLRDPGIWREFLAAVPEPGDCRVPRTG